MVIVDFAPFEAAGGHGHHHHPGHGGAHGQHGQHLGHDVESAQPHSGETNAPNNAFPAAASATIRTHGFSEEAMNDMFAEAGFREFRYREMEGEVEMWVGPEGEKRRVTRTVVLGVGVV